MKDQRSVKQVLDEVKKSVNRMMHKTYRLADTMKQAGNDTASKYFSDLSHGLDKAEQELALAKEKLG